MLVIVECENLRGSWRKLEEVGGSGVSGCIRLYVRVWFTLYKKIKRK